MKTMKNLFRTCLILLAGLPTLVTPLRADVDSRRHQHPADQRGFLFQRSAVDELSWPLLPASLALRRQATLKVNYEIQM
jgi:hypothetical protein